MTKYSEFISLKEGLGDCQVADCLFLAAPPCQAPIHRLFIEDLTKWVIIIITMIVNWGLDKLLDVFLANKVFAMWIIISVLLQGEF